MKYSTSTCTSQSLHSTSTSEAQALDASRTRLLAHRASLHKTLANAISTALPAASARALAARKRYIKAAASLDHATLRAASARNTLAKLLHSTVHDVLPPVCASADQLASDLVSTSDQHVQEWLLHVSQLTSTPPAPLSATDADAQEITRLSTVVSDVTSSLVAMRAETVKLQAFRDALLSAPTPPPPTHSQHSRLWSETQRLASSLATTQLVSLPITRNLTQSRQAHAARVSLALTSARDAIVKHAAILRILSQVLNATQMQSNEVGRRIQWIRENVIGECVRQVTPAAAPASKSSPGAADVSDLVERVTSQLTIPLPAADHSSVLLKLSNAGHAVQCAVQKLLTAAPLPTLDASCGDDQVSELVSETVTELTLSVPRAAEMVAAHDSLTGQDDEQADWVRWLMGEVRKAEQEYHAAGAAGLGGDMRRKDRGNGMLDEYL
ncbi:hypothetical protein BCR44DRAFT_1490052 [Catenaria anguillulae PL171]|uniref:Uncharacterized protein n=1 Tax=Catenaria anguillulae PL171 TaxID=765915 RepID=A0A1Y2H4L4_9FUNG|nr:hypothetical protein BCR44DRAFT_1490052 [Catenaria anguillulae PL171]